jgi:hypothetical protein
VSQNVNLLSDIHHYLFFTWISEHGIVKYLRNDIVRMTLCVVRTLDGQKQASIGFERIEIP